MEKQNIGMWLLFIGQNFNENTMPRSICDLDAIWARFAWVCGVAVSRAVIKCAAKIVGWIWSICYYFVYVFALFCVWSCFCCFLREVNPNCAYNSIFISKLRAEEVCEPPIERGIALKPFVGDCVALSGTDWRISDCIFDAWPLHFIEGSNPIRTQLCTSGHRLFRVHWLNILTLALATCICLLWVTRGY